MPNYVDKILAGVKGEITFVLGFFASIYRENLEEHVHVLVAGLVELVPLDARESLAEDVASLISFMGRRRLHAISVVAESEMHEHLPYPLDTPGWFGWERNKKI